MGLADNRTVRRGALCAAALLLAPLGAKAAPIEAYGRLPTIADVRLSPSGRSIAYLATTQGDRVVTIFPRDGAAKPVLLKVGRADLRALEWADEDHVLVTTGAVEDTPLGIVPGTKREYLHAFLYDLRTGKTVLLQPPEEARGLNVVLSEPVVRTVNGRRTVFFKSRTPRERVLVPTLFQADVASGAIRQIDQGSLTERDFVIGPTGAEVARSFFADGKWSMEIRTAGGWRTTALDGRVDVPSFEGLGPTGDTLFVGNAPVEGQEDLRALRQVSISTGAWVDPPAGGVIRHDPQTGLALADEVREAGAVYHFFDPAVQRRWEAILKAFPGEQADFVATSDDRKVWVVRVFGPKTGAAYMLVDLNTGKGELIGDIYKDVAPADVAPVRMIRYAAADGLDIPAYLTLPPGRPAKDLPLVVLPHDGLASRDSLDFDWLAQALASRGYAVLQPQYRGSTGFGPALREAGYGQWGRKAESDLADGVRYLAAQGTVDPKRACIVGAGFGGFAALEGVAEGGVYRCAVSIGGVTDIGLMLDWQQRKAFTYYTAAVPFIQRYAGAQTVSPLKMAGQFQAPVLLIHGRDDVMAPFDQSQAMADALKAAHKPVTLVALPGEDHALSKSDTRLQALKATVDFLQANNPADPPRQAVAAGP